MTGPSSSGRRAALLPVLLLLLAAGLLCTGSDAFRVRDPPADVCVGEKCPESSRVQPKRVFKPVSTRGGFVKPPPEPEDGAQDEKTSVEEESVNTKWKEKKITRSWAKVAKVKEDESKEDDDDDDVSSAGEDEDDPDKEDSDDELIQIEVEDENEEDEVSVEDDDESSASKEKLLMEQERKRKEEEEKKRLIEEKKKKEKEEMEKRKKEEKKRKEFEEQKKRKEEEERLRKEKELEEKRKKEEIEKRLKEEAERRLKEAEQKRKEEERKRKEEEERKRKEEAERKRKEEEERKRKEEEERKRKEEEERKRKELEERKRKEEEERKRKEEEERRRKKEEEERKRKEEAERKRKEEEERKRKEEEERKRKEEEEEEEKRLKIEEEKRLKEEEERRLREEEECRLAEEEEERLKAIEERVLKEEEERKKREEEERKKKKLLEAEKKKKEKEEAERLKREKEDKENEKKRDAIEDKKRVERLKREAEEAKLREKEEKKNRLNPKKKKKKKKVEDDEDEDDEDDDDDDDDEDDEKDDSLKVKKTVEKLRSTEKEKAKPTEAAPARAKPPAAKSTKAPTKPAPKPTASDKKSEKPAKKSTTAEPAKTATRPKRSGPEALLSLAELNDMILSVPTFVPNFTAVENPACQQHGKIFLRQLRGYKLWALQMLDSSAKIPAGLLRGNVNQLGDFDQCLGVMARVKVEDKTVKVQGKYCLASVDLYASHPAAKLPVNLMQSRALIRGNIRDPGHFVPRFTTANWAVCLPAVCSADDARRTIENALNDYNATIGIKFVVDIDADNCYVKPKSSSYSKETIGVLYFYAMFVCLAIVATLRDYFGNAQEKGNYSERIIMAFSLKRTLKALFGNKETSSSDIGCIHGIRALSTVALYVAHKLIPTSRIPYANRASLTEVASHPLSLLLRASLFYTDSFLLLSGVLTAYNMAKELQNRGEIRWFCRLIARYMRLTPSLLAVVYWYAFVMEHTGSGPQWNSAVKANADICKENSWINFLYVQNFFPFEEMCAPHTHQLALDMQLSLAAPALVFFLQIRPVIGIIVVFFLIQVSATLRYFATSNNNLSLVIFHGMTIKHLYKTANMTYTLPLHRATPYLFGVSLGVLLHYVGKNVRLNKIISIVGWSIALALGTWSIFSPWRLARRDYVYNVDEATHYAVVSPIVSALALSWMIFACFTDNSGFINRILSNYWMVVFSKLSYAVYLSQFAVFFYNVGTTRYSSEFHPFRALDPLEAGCVVLVSIVLTLLFDIPMQEVKNIIMESSDYSSVASEKPKEAVEEKHNNVKGIPQESSFEDEEPAPGGWNWERGTFTRLATSQPRDYDDGALDEPPCRGSRLKRQDVRRQTIIRSDTLSSAYDEWDPRDSSRRTSRSEEPMDDRRASRECRFSGSGLEDELAGDNYLYARERVYSRAFSKSPIRDLDAPITRRSLSRERRVSGESDVTSREYGNKPLITISKEDDYHQLRSPRASIPRFPEQQRSLSSESELDLSSSRRSSTSFTRHSSIEPRIVDEDEWEEDVRLRRNRFFQDRLNSQERDHVPPPIAEEEVDDEWDSLKRRSSAEGKMALLKEPIRPGNIALWTVSKIHLGSSQEPDDEDLDEDGYHRKRTEYREQGPPLREEFEGEEEGPHEGRRKSFTGGSLPTSFEEEDDVSDFSLRSDNKRITVQDLSRTMTDLSRLSSEEEPHAESNPNQLDVKPALIKRESMIKSQASEEDPEYLLPERPKLVEQEQEHPFKKAWQMQKSRSEEEGPFIVKEVKSASTSLEKQDEEPEDRKEEEGEEEDEDEDKTSHEGAQSQESDMVDVSCDVTLVWQGPKKNGGFSKSRSSSESDREDGDEQADQIDDGYRGRRKSDEENWTWTEKDT